MRKYNTFSFLFILIIVPVLSLGQAPNSELERILTQHIESRGGSEKIQSLKSIRMSGNARLQDVVGQVTLVLQRPNLIRIDLTLDENISMIQAHDGTSAVMLAPFQGITEPEPLSDESRQQLMQQADFEGIVFQYLNPDYTFSFDEVVRLENGTDAYQISIIDPLNNRTTLFIDTQSYLVIKEVSLRKTTNDSDINVAFSRVEVWYDRYVYKQNLSFPTSIKTFVDGREISQITIENIILNPSIQKEYFTLTD